MRHLPITEAARVLGISRRTVERRVKAGTLRATSDTGRTLIAVPDEVIDATGAPVPSDTATGATPRQVRHDSPDSAAQIAALEAELVAVRAERDRLWRHVEDLTVLSAQLGARALPPGPVADQPAPAVEPPRPWWRFWRR